MTEPLDRDRHLLDLASMSRERMVGLLSRARSFDDGTGSPKHHESRRRMLVGRSVCNLFFEDSTRTRVSFSLAARGLGAGTTNLTAPGSSITKGETIVDTASNVEATGGDALVVRCSSAGAPELIARHVSVPVINAGDGSHEHPTQGLLDVYALSQALGREDSFDLTDLNIAIVGDIASSRVARSDIAAMTRLGARVVCVGPAPLAPKSLESLGCTVSADLDSVLGEVDAVQMLRLQFERHAGAKPGEKPSPPGVGSVREYRALYALTETRARLMKPGSVVMHPGPINRGLEMDGAVADGLDGGPRSIVLAQVSAGVLVRMAVLTDLLGQHG
ncbi:MAG TPA: aspartate carbamoyltransferase catalytic subunit [Phycisphaerales bacterium]|nr:aspartate carbamoyltransferase catalytic subunit [Phycisphaerales bacterium]